MILEGLQDKHNFTPDRIYNVDETGVSTIPNQPSQIIAAWGSNRMDYCLHNRIMQIQVSVPTEITLNDDTHLIMQMLSLLNDEKILLKKRYVASSRTVTQIDLTNADLTKLSTQLADRDTQIAELDKNV